MLKNIVQKVNYYVNIWLRAAFSRYIFVFNVIFSCIGLKKTSTIRLELSENIYLQPKFYRHERTY
ncbi:hypothetical protein BA768_09140 [Chryseobacterium sp. CBo1]|nr:hypothetical protein BA768_09140 [Chryseobacterium sp. CBo1]